MTGKRILAVENNDLVLSFLEDGLIAAGYQVDTASNGREALEKIDRTEYDLIISDVRMPEIDGAALCRLLAARGAVLLTRLVFLASPDSFDDHQTFLEQTGVPVLTKPVEFEDLRSVVERMLGQIVEPAET
jgi:DNA-binding response OmpR family regulator